MNEYKNDGKPRFGIRIYKGGLREWLLGFSIAYEKFHHMQSELYLNIF